MSEFVFKIDTEIMAIVGEIRSQSDRGATILAASVISTFLEKAILTKLTPTSNRRRVKLFRGFGPLSTLSSRIEIAYSLGLFDEDYYGRLNAIKDIRNEFAHSIVPLTFQSENIRKLCMKLNFKIEPPISTEREQFLESVAEFLCVLTEMPVPGFS